MAAFDANATTSEMLSTMGKTAPNFFGLTSLGTNHLADARPRSIPFHNISPDDFVECFRLHRNEELEQALLVRRWANRTDLIDFPPP